MTTPPTLKLQIEPDLEELTRVNEAIACFLQEVGLPAQLRQVLELCSEEWLVNVISYGIPEESSGPIGYELAYVPDQIVLTITHKGVEFDPLEHVPEPVPLDSEDRMPGGLGIPLIQSLMDDVVYSRPEGINCLRMAKNTKEYPIIMDDNLFQLTVTVEPPVTILSLKGRLDVLTSKELREKLMAAIETDQPRIVLDLGGLEYVSSAGLRVLLEARKSMKQKNGSLVLAAVQPFTRTVLVSTGFDTLFTIYATAEEAGAALRG